jgi:chromosomal replication initiation ATPase DnaA
VNEPRNVAVYLAKKRCGLRLEEIGREFEIVKYSSVSSIVTRVEKQLLTNKEIQDRVTETLLKLDRGHLKA